MWSVYFLYKSLHRTLSPCPSLLVCHVWCEGYKETLNPPPVTQMTLNSEQPAKTYVVSLTFTHWPYLTVFFLGLICFCFSLHPGQKAAWHSQVFSPWAIPNEGGMHLSIRQLKQQSKISQTLAHGPVESVHGLGNRMLASNAQGLGFSPQYCKAKHVKRLLWWSYCPCCLAPEAEASPTIGHQPQEVPETEFT